MTSNAHADILIVTVTKVETTAVLNAFGVGQQATPQSIEDRVYFDLGIVNGAHIKLTRSEMGTGGLGASLQAVGKGIDALSPTAVIMVGIAFGVNENNQKIGDILVTEQLRPYDLQRIGTQKNRKAQIILRDDKPHASPRLLNLLKSSEVTWKGAPLRFGTILTGAKLVDNLDFRAQLSAFELEAIGGEMEGAGLYVACHDRKVDWILVKAICDFADGQKAKDKAKRQALAAKNAAAFVHHALGFAKPLARNVAADGARGIHADSAGTSKDRVVPAYKPEMLVGKLESESLDFAKAHIAAYYDSDFFPRADEFEALWTNWDDVKAHLLASSVESLYVDLPRSMPAPKHHGGYRIVHQLEPLTAIVYTALAHMVAADVEAARSPKTSETAFSYRISLSTDSFFTAGNGYPEFVERCRELASANQYVLVADIADFYNRIYLHHLRNALSFANLRLSGIAKSVEDFLTRLNQKASQGIPIGPSASIVFSEATLIDVDQFVANRGLVHTRYVDDLHIFSQSTDALESLTEELVAYLFDSHRLQLSWSKHQLLASSDYIDKYLETPAVIERRELLGVAQVICDYGDSYTESDVDGLIDKYLERRDEEDEPPLARTGPLRDILEMFRQQQVQERKTVRRAALEALLTTAVKSPPLDIGLARHTLRRGRELHAVELVEAVLEHFVVLAPVLPDVFLYLHAVASHEVLTEHISLFERAFTSKFVAQHRFVRHWVDWFRSLHPEILRGDALREFWRSAAIEHQARAARKLRNLAWVRDQKSRIATLGLWDRRAVLMAAEVMPIDERRLWTDGVTAATSDIVEKSICAWLGTRP